MCLLGTSGSPPVPTAQGDPFALVYGDQLYVLYRNSNQIYLQIADCVSQSHYTP